MENLGKFGEKMEGGGCIRTCMYGSHHFLVHVLFLGKRVDKLTYVTMYLYTIS